MREIYVLTTKDIFCALGVFLLSFFGTVLIFINFYKQWKGRVERKEEELKSRNPSWKSKREKGNIVRII
jgi:hypothetical protein